MKSLAELQEIRDKAFNQMNLRKEHKDGIRVVVGMATCGIAAGARPVLNTFIQEINKYGISDITVTQTDCMGMCRLEPMVEVYIPGQEKVTYIHMTPEKAVKVVTEHIINKKPVSEYTLGSESN